MYNAFWNLKVEAEDLLSRPSGSDNPREWSRWRSKCQQTIHEMGSAGELWRGSFNHELTERGIAQMVGVIDALTDLAGERRLPGAAESARAETMRGFISQAEQLLADGYVIAAGMLGRVALEEYLRNWARLVVPAGIPPSKKPSIQTYKSILDTRLSPSEKKDIEWMAGIGNDCAHARTGGPSNSDVEDMLARVRRFIDRQIA